MRYDLDYFLRRYPKAKVFNSYFDTDLIVEIDGVNLYFKKDGRMTYFTKVQLYKDRPELLEKFDLPRNFAGMSIAELEDLGLF